MQCKEITLFLRSYHQCLVRKFKYHSNYHFVDGYFDCIVFFDLNITDFVETNFD